MTPDDVAAIRERARCPERVTDWLTEREQTLLDALEAAWAEREHMLPETEIAPVLACENLDVLRHAIIGVKRGQVQLRERAERAEAERDAYSQKRCTVVDHDITAIETLRERAERAERLFAEESRRKEITRQRCERAEAERDRYRLHAEMNGKEVYGLYSHWRERAEVAEARMTDELIQLREALDLTDCRAERAEAELLSTQVLLEGSTNRAKRAEVEVERLREHSVQLNTLCWTIAELVGDVAEDQTERPHDFDNTLRQLDRLSGKVARRAIDAELERANAALARVRALCDVLHSNNDPYATVVSERLRAAIEGDPT